MVILLMASLTLCLVVVIFLAVRIDRGYGPCLELSPSLIFYAAFAGYGLAMPISRLVVHSQETPGDLGYLQQIVVVAISMTVGALLAAAVGQYRRAPVERASTQGSATVAALLAWSALFVYLFKWLSEANFQLDQLFAAYGVGAKAYDETTMFDTAVTVFAVAANWAAFRFLSQSSLSRFKMLLLLLPAFILSVFFTLRGNRNMVVIQLLPLLVMYLRGRVLKIVTACLAAAFAYVGLYMVGVIRNFGFDQLQGVEVKSSAFDPLHGELGTVFSVYEKVDSLAGDELLLGHSYLFDTITNLVPRQLWPDRPLTAAQVASIAYYGGQLTEGIGYSPIAESRVNFGPFGYPLVFIVFPLALAIIEGVFDDSQNRRAIYYAAMTPMLINFWRIDFATMIKMWILFTISLSVCARVASSRTSTSRRI